MNLSNIMWITNKNKTCNVWDEPLPWKSRRFLIPTQLKSISSWIDLYFVKTKVTKVRVLGFGSSNAVVSNVGQVF